MSKFSRKKGELEPNSITQSWPVVPPRPSLARDIDQPVPILPVSGSGEPVKSPVESSAEKCRNGYSDHDSANSDHSSVDDRESNRIEVLELENEDLKQQIELLKMCLSQKDVFQVIFVKNVCQKKFKLTEFLVKRKFLNKKGNKKSF